MADKKNSELSELSEEKSENADKFSTNMNIKELATPPAPPVIEIMELDNEPPLGGKSTRGKVETTALDKKQERDLAEAKLRAMIKDTAPKALETVITIMTNTDARDETRLKAAQDILDRGLGKAKQTVDNELKGGIQIKLSPALEEFSE